jgi:hypothetical protein
MKAHFDWQTEESSPQGDAEFTGNFSASRRTIGCLTFTIILIVIIISAFIWLVNDTQSNAVASVKEDVLLAFELRQQAAGVGDGELFSALLSSKDTAWKRDQERLFASNLINDRIAIGLTANSPTQDHFTLDLSPDLQQAELSFVQEYRIVEVLSSDQEIELLRSLTFHLEDGRWKYAPPDLAFWGPWKEEEGEFISIAYPARDTEFAAPLVDLIDSHLKDLCAKVREENQFGKVFCQGNKPWRIRLHTEEETLLNLADASKVGSSQFDFELPTPTIVGVPLNEKDLEVYLELYTKSILQRMESALLTTAPFPDQHIYALCFQHPLSGQHLYRFDWRLRSWQSVLPQKKFQYLSALPDDSAIMMAEDDTITMIYGNTVGDSTDQNVIWEGNAHSLNLKILLGWIETVDTPYFLLMALPSADNLPDYSALDVLSCNSQSCLAKDLPGFPIPSVLSDASLFVDGSIIVLDPGGGEGMQSLGDGFSPFWINGQTFGYVRFQGDVKSGITTQVVLGDLVTRELRTVVDGFDLSSKTPSSQADGLYIHDVIPNPADSNHLLISSTGIREYSGNYFIFSLDISKNLSEAAQNGLKLEVTRKSSLAGVPGLLSPTGFPTFLPSQNGRWLAITELNSLDRENWTVLIHDLHTGISSEVVKNVLALPGTFPIMDWSRDGEWLMIADREYLHLIAPGNDYEEFIAHDFDACSTVVWAE